MSPKKAETFAKRLPNKDGDSVNHPAHYNLNPSGTECIDVVEHMTFNTGNAVKYVWRAGLKVAEDQEALAAQIHDLRKAVWYIEREITRLSK